MHRTMPDYEYLGVQGRALPELDGIQSIMGKGGGMWIRMTGWAGVNAKHAEDCKTGHRKGKTRDSPVSPFAGSNCKRTMCTYFVHTVLSWEG